MPVRIVQSKQNPRLKELRRALTRPGRDTHGLAGIEGANLLAEALRAGLRLSCVFVAEEALDSLEALDLHPEMDVVSIPRALLNSVLATETPQPVAALAQMPEWTWEGAAQSHAPAAPLFVILAGLQDPGNLGTILRSAEAFGATAVVSLPGTVCAWNPKAVRASAGSVFRVPVLSTTVHECFTRLRVAGVRVLTTALEGAEPAPAMNFTGPAAFIIGNEGNGVADEIAAQADATVTIPCPGPVESLNAAVAASVLLYEASRQRSELAAASQALRRSTR